MRKTSTTLNLNKTRGCFMCKMTMFKIKKTRRYKHTSNPKVLKKTKKLQLLGLLNENVSYRCPHFSTKTFKID